jgi:hypothetical protein
MVVDIGLASIYYNCFDNSGAVAYTEEHETACKQALLPFSGPARSFFIPQAPRPVNRQIDFQNQISQILFIPLEIS